MTEHTEIRALVDEALAAVQRLTADECRKETMCNEAAAIILDLARHIKDLERKLGEADAALLLMNDHCSCDPLTALAVTMIIDEARTRETEPHHTSPSPAPDQGER